MTATRLCILFSVLVCIAVSAADKDKAATSGFPPHIAGARVETYKKVEGVELKVWILEPAGALVTNRPAIVFFFGGGWNGGTPTQFEPHGRHFAERGMVALLADYRVRSRHGVKPSQCVADARSCVRWIRTNSERLGVDPNRIVAAGGSAGGHLAAATATLPGPDERGEDTSIRCIPNALVLFNPALVLAEYGDLKLKGFGTRMSPERLGAEPQSLSPIHHLRPGTPPTIIFHGKADSTVPYSTVEAFAGAMEEMGNRCELNGYEGQPHGFFNAKRGGGEFYRRTLAKTDQFLASLGYLPVQE